MANPSNALESMQDMTQKMQTAFAPSGGFGSQSTHFWKAQDLFLREFEKFSEAWFSRRHEATKTAMDACQQLAEHGAADPAKAMTVLTEWQAHSTERMAEDFKGYMAMLSACTGVAAAEEIEATRESIETVKRSTKTAKSRPV